MSPPPQTSSSEDDLFLHVVHLESKKYENLAAAVAASASALHPKDDDDTPIVNDARGVPIANDTKKHESSFLTTFREFLCMAFCDHYQDTYCCNTINPATYCCAANNIPDNVDILRTKSSASSYREISNCPSQDSKKRRLKPLAIAVGFNYANDLNGRPVIITPGRKTPIMDHSQGSRNSRITSPYMSPSLSTYQNTSEQSGLVSVNV